MSKNAEKAHDFGRHTKKTIPKTQTNVGGSSRSLLLPPLEPSSSLDRGLDRVSKAGAVRASGSTSLVPAASWAGQETERLGLPKEAVVFGTKELRISIK